MTPSLPTGISLLRNPLLNKGTAFTNEERDALGLRGLLPPHVATQEEQLERVLRNFRAKSNDLDRYVNLAALHDRNETLFYRLITSHPDEMMPVIYTPTVGLACQKFGHIFQRPRGLFVSCQDSGNVSKVLQNWPERNVKIIVVTDGERILGLGDLGANGMGIPVGKLALYTAAAGIDPAYCLPVVLDVGTNNPELLRDPLYIGLRQKRLTGEAYDALIEEFIQAATKAFPGVLIQFEDFANHNAFRLLKKYRSTHCTFNDDIQGTAAVTLAGILSALRITQESLCDQRILFLGAGEAATGIADLTVTAMQDEGMSEKAARERCWLFDSQGLVNSSRKNLVEHKLAYAHDIQQPVTDFLEAIHLLKPTAIIGVAAVAGSFTQPIVEAMLQYNQRPIIFALSNPTSKSECTAEQAYVWSQGRALFASGSPFPQTSFNGQRFVSRQSNNMYIFPGMGLGILASGTTRVTDEMFVVAARTLADQVTEKDLEQGSLFPPLSIVQDVSAKIAAALYKTALEQGLATHSMPEDMESCIRSHMYVPRYRNYLD